LLQDGDAGEGRAAPAFGGCGTVHLHGAAWLLPLHGRRSIVSLPPVEPSDVTVQILGEIRDEIRSTSSRLDQTNSRLEEVRAELVRRLVETEIRLATAITSFQGTLGELKSQG
jgi:hypothetical protein